MWRSPLAGSRRFGSPRLLVRQLIDRAGALHQWIAPRLNPFIPGLLGTPENPGPDGGDRWPHRVLVMTWRDPWHPEAGGAEVMLYEHVSRWTRWGHEVTVFTARYPGAPREEVRDGLRIIRGGGRFTIYLWAAFLYMVRLRHETDAVLDIENGIPFFTPLYSRKPRLCLVHHVHRDQFLSEFGPVIGRVGRFLECTLMPVVYRSTRFLAVSESTKHDLEQIGIPASRCRVVHNGLDHASYRSAARRSTTPRLLYVGRLKRHKRVDLLIELTARLRERVPNVVLDIVGGGDDEERLRALVTSRGLEGVVRFHGFTSHARKVALYSRSWALMTATEREGWGLSVIEAAACGTPALSLDVPGVRDAIVQGVSGWLAPTLESLYEAALRVLTDPAWRRQLSDGALERSQTFAWRTSAAGAREVLADVWLDRSSAPHRRRSLETVRATLIFDSQTVPDSIRKWAPKPMRDQLRAGDRVSIVDDEIHVEIALASHGGLDVVERRLRRALGDLAARTASAPRVDEVASA